jgi:iron complex outermembrane receptor protein
MGVVKSSAGAMYLRFGISSAVLAVCLFAQPAQAQATATDAAAPANPQDAPPAAAPAKPQEAPPAAAPVPQDEGTIKDIIITANRRSESLQKAPLAVTAVTGDRIKALGITSAQGLAQVVPNLVIGQNGSSAQVGIRGAISTTPGPFADPAVGFSVDGVYLARASAALSALYDIGQVEVLRGPQGTLYGRNTIAGLINVITAKPKLDKVEGNVALGYGNYNDLQSSGMLNVPVGSTLAFRAAFSTHRHDGYADNSPGLNSSDLDSIAGRFQALFKPSDRFSALLSVSYYHNGGVGGGGVTGGAPLGIYATSAGATPFNYQTVAKGAFNDETTKDATLTLNYELPFVTATYVGNLRSDHYDGAGSLAPQGPIVLTFPKGLCATVTDPKCFLLNTRNYGKQNSQEFRLSHNSDVLKWVLGYYYFRYSDNSITTQTPAASGAANDVFRPGRNIETTNAVFGQATLSPVPRLRLTGGMRYNDEYKFQFTQNHTGPVGSVVGITCPGCTTVAAPSTGSFRLKKVTWRGAVDFDITKDVLVFASVANGFKNGGINNNGSTFLPEQILNYEAGLKASLFGHRLQVNIDAFHELYTNYQSTAGQLVGNSISLITVNAGKATIDGVEVETLAQITRRDRLSVNGTYLRAYFTSFFLPFGDGFNGQQPEDLSGNRVPYTPKVTLQGDYQHTFDLASGGTIVSRISSIFTDSQELDYHNFPVLHVPSYTRTEFSLTYNSPKMANGISWSLMAYVKNIEDKAVLVTGQADNTVPLPLIGTAGKDGFYLAPRTYGFRASLSF